MVLSKILFALRIIFIRACTVTALACLLSQVALAQASTPPNVATMLMNFSASVPKLMQLVTAVAYVLGMFLIVKGVLGLKQFGDQRTQMSANAELKAPLILLFVGTALLYLPSSVEVGMSTFWSIPNPYGYITDTQDQWSIIYQDGFLVIQLIGTISFIRGLLVLTHLGQQAQPGTFGKAMAHIIGGILLINLYDFLNIMNNTLGIVPQ